MGDASAQGAEVTAAGLVIAQIRERLQESRPRASPNAAPAKADLPAAPLRAQPPAPGRPGPDEPAKTCARDATRGRERHTCRQESGLAATLLQCASLPPSVLMASFFLSLLGLALPLAMLQIYDRIVPNQSTETLLLLAIGLAVAFLLEAVLKVVRSYVMGWDAVLTGFHRELDAVVRMLKARQDAVDKQPPGTWIDGFDALGELNGFRGGHGRLILIDLPLAAIFLVIMVLVGGALALVPVATMAGFGTLAALKGRALQRVLANRSEQDNKRHDFLVECLSGIHTIKGLAMEPQMQRRYERLQKATALASHGTILFGNRLQTLGILFANLTMVCVVTVGALMVMDGRISIGALACCALLSGRFAQPLLRGIGVWTELQNVELANERARTFETLRLPAGTTATALPEVRGAITFLAACHWYDTPEKARLGEIDLEIAPGEVVGLLGEDGSGRSTLAALILGDLPPTRGAVRIDGVDASGPQQAALRRQIAYVPARPSVFEGTILENLTMFRTGDSVEAARRAARLIGLEDDIHLLPEGYDTPLGKGIAEALSGGLLQRIAIARALAMEPRILILDEANTLLDFRSERLLREGLAELSGDVTILLISNRPSLLALADRVLELRDGRLSVPESPVPAAVPAPDRAIA